MHSQGQKPFRKFNETGCLSCAAAWQTP